LNAHLKLSPSDRIATTENDTESERELDRDQENDGDLEIAIATCHTLNDVHGDLLGSPIDQELFQATGWKLHHHKWTTTIGGGGDGPSDGRVLPVLSTVRKVSGVMVTSPTTAAGSGLVVLSGGGPTPFNTPAGGTFPGATPIINSIPSTPVTPHAAGNAEDGTPLQAHHFGDILMVPGAHATNGPTVVSTGELPSPRSVDGSEAHILKRFDFEAQLQRSSVIFKLANSDKLYAVTKGSPEAIRNVCKPGSIPPDFYENQMGYAGRGYYVLAYGLKQVSVGANPTSAAGNRAAAGKLGINTEKHILPENFTAEDLAGCKRETIERDLRFIGFVVMKNPLKAESAATITLMKDAGIQSVIM
jgi:magnesium-transporting ATPase (P-type)